MAWTQEKINDVYSRVQNRASFDGAFRAKILSDPVSAVRDVSGEDLPEHFSVRVIENAEPYQVAIALPPLVPARGPGELSDSDLEGVVGGVACEGAFEACGAQVVK